jgi:two-component system, cell cycle sensor histidine kinase and response regulator CckA
MSTYNFQTITELHEAGMKSANNNRQIKNGSSWQQSDNKIQNPLPVGVGSDSAEINSPDAGLWESEKMFRFILEHLDGVVFIADDTGILTYVSPAVQRVLGFEPHEVTGTPVFDYLEPESVSKAHSDFFDIILNISRLKVFEFRLRKKNGSFFWAEAHLQYYGEHGSFGVIGLLQDISRRKRIESITLFRLHLLEIAEVMSVEELLRTALDESERLTESSIGFVHFVEQDQERLALQIWSTNTINKMCRLEGKAKRSQLISAGIWADAFRERKTVIHNDFSSLRHRCVMPAGHVEIKRELVVPVMRGSEVMAILGVGNKLSCYDEGDVRAVEALAGMLSNVVSHKLAEQSKEKMQEKLNQLQKMELVGQLAGGIAHDFNNMLEVILGHAEIALDQVDPDLPLHADITTIQKAATRTADLTRQLLGFARKQTVMPEILDLNERVEGLLDMLKYLAGKSVTLDWIAASSPVQVKIDSSQIDQILVNLCVNSRDAIDGIGTITIETGSITVEEADRDSLHFCREPGNYVTLSVSDNGTGISKKDFPHIFEPFFTTKEQGKGTGMGLSTVFGIVKQNHGCIECHSEEGNGTIIKIYLPQFRERRNSEQEPDGLLIHCNSDTILLVEDEPEILKLCQLMLEQYGYKVLLAPTPHAALRIAEGHPGGIDLLLTDVIMPEMNGCDLAKMILSVRPNLKTLFMSGYNIDIISRLGVLDEGINYMQKPFSFKSLMGTLESILKPGVVN